MRSVVLETEIHPKCLIARGTNISGNLEKDGKKEGTVGVRSAKPMYFWPEA
jgi:hypothetical protein